LGEHLSAARGYVIAKIFFPMKMKTRAKCPQILMMGAAVVAASIYLAACGGGTGRCSEYSKAG
jgi:hypothetical protein